MPVYAFRRPDQTIQTETERHNESRLTGKPLGDMLQIMAASAPYLIPYVEQYVLDLWLKAGPPEWWLS